MSAGRPCEYARAVSRVYSAQNKRVLICTVRTVAGPGEYGRTRLCRYRIHFELVCAPMQTCRERQTDRFRYKARVKACT
jgi:hypothetical protein